MVDREARDKLAAALRAYMADEITAFEFDDRIFTAARRTRDRTARSIRCGLWQTYDDIVDHKVLASEPLWDWFNRVLLLLQSDAELEDIGRRRWTARQSAALCGIAAFAAAVYCAGWTAQLVPVWLALCFLSVALARLSQRANDAWLADQQRFAPFGSVREILIARRAAPGFRRVRCRSDIRNRTVRGAILDADISWVVPLLRIALGPIALLGSLPPEDLRSSHAVFGTS